ncbi:TPA: hypothetical protein NIJ27_006520 [Pseudomonas aeruginosa]|nr:hypothetical protein [Pseudomonas aeruginosa]
MNTWVSFQSAEQPLLGQFSVSGNILVLSINALIPLFAHRRYLQQEFRRLRREENK